MGEDFPQEERPLVEEVVDQAALVEQDSLAHISESELTHIPVHTEDETQAEEEAADGSADPANDTELEERLNDLRERGRVGVLTEGTERNDTTDRLKNSDNDPEAIALVNKANRENMPRDEEGKINRKKIG